MTCVLGLDIGSRTVDAVWMKDDRVTDAVVLDSGFAPQEACRRIVAGRRPDLIVATGYGRHAARESLGSDRRVEIITEIGAYALGAARLHPRARSILDIGGQDTKVIALAEDGRVADFEMNDKCAAGTGRFLEVMARALGLGLAELADAALAADGEARVSSMCTVFAESEVVGLVHRGEDRSRVARGLHAAIARRTLAAVGRMGATAPLLFAGGVARNPAMIRLLREGFEGELLVPDEPELMGALGAAAHGSRSA